MSSTERNEAFDLWSWASDCTAFRTASYSALGASVLGLDLLTNADPNESLEIPGIVGLSALALVSTVRAYKDYRRTRAEVDASHIAE